MQEGLPSSFQLESRCKMLVAENQHLEAMVHKYRTEYDVDTAYLKNQVKNERDRQMQWKDLYFKAHAELMDLKRHTHNAPFQRNVNNNKSIEGEYGPAWQPRSRTRTESDCQECENERKRKASDSEASGRHPSSQNPYPHGQENRLAVSTHSVPAGPPPPPPPVKPGIHHSPVEKPPDEGLNRPPGIPMLNQPPQDVSRPPFPHMIPSQVYKPEMLPRDSQQPPNQYFKCSVCGIYYDTEEKLHFHMELHSGERYAGPGSMVNDMHEMSNLQTPFDYLICPECNQSFKTDDDYRRHLLVHVFKCRLCGQTMENEMSFLVHVKGHGENNSQPYHCFLCDKQFSHVSHLTRHVLSHPDEQPFECVECGKHFARKGHLTRHMTMHSKCRPYTCTDCGKTFAHRTHLRRHEIVHSGLRPHKCKVCQQSFSRKSSLSRHYFIHTTEKPFVCPICEKGFNRKGRLKNHLKIHIREGYPELVDYVIERRPITKEFIEKINMVKPDDGTIDNTDFSTNVPKTEASGTAPGFKSSGSFPTPEKPAAERELGAEIKEESDDSSSSESEGEIDEVEAELSEEITYYEPPKSSDLSMTSMVTMVPPRSNTSSKTVEIEETKSTSTVVTVSASPPLSPSAPLPPASSSSTTLPPESSSSSSPSDNIPHHPVPDS